MPHSSRVDNFAFCTLHFALQNACQEAIFTKAKTLLAKCSKAKSWERQMSTKKYYVNGFFVICGMLKNTPAVNKPVNNVENSYEIGLFFPTGAVYPQNDGQTFGGKSGIFFGCVKIMSPCKPMFFSTFFDLKVSVFVVRFP